MAGFGLTKSNVDIQPIGSFMNFCSGQFKAIKNCTTYATILRAFTHFTYAL